MRHVACTGGKGKVCRVLVGKREGRCRLRWEDKISPLIPELIVWFLNVCCVIKAVLCFGLYLSLALEHHVA